MGFLKSFSLISMLFFLCFGVSRAVDCELNNNDPHKVAYTITVDPSGQGNFTKVQDAIDSIPSGNTRWIRIFLNPGVYREEVKIGRHKTCILLVGQNHDTTSIESDVHDPTTDTSATFTSEAENFVAKQITFKNTYNLGGRVSDRTQAVAARIKGDKSSFYNCGFFGLQDTIWDVIGRHYFESCEIEGAANLIWGNGQSIYTNAHVLVNGAGLAPGSEGYITAQGRSTEKDGSGFVFLGGVVDGSGSAFLGRAYQPYSTVLFYKSTFSQVVNPAGWDASFYAGHEDTLTLAESNCGGPGSDTSRRVSWEKKLEPYELDRFTDISFIDPEGWLNKQPSHY